MICFPPYETFVKTLVCLRAILSNEKILVPVLESKDPK